MNRSRRWLMLAAAFVTLPLQAAPTILVSETYYNIQGQTAAELRAHMKAKRCPTGSIQCEAVLGAVDCST